ncbi:MAG: tetratricopeptide repeat protein [candidate division Zixibacteria bacterium]|nr:tetratricopeptide repeat protein [candidate division Zixibacteria bacterium]
MLRFYAILIMVMVTSVSATPATDSLFLQGNQAYEDKDYESAIDKYLAALSHGVESAPLYYNLGNAYFKAGDLGRAVLSYHRARRLAPDDEDLVHNLEFARQFPSVQMEGVKLNPINSFMESLVASYRLDTLAWAMSAIFILFCLLLMVRFGLGYNNPLQRVSTVVVLVILLGISGLTTFKYRTDYLTRWAVVVADESLVLSGPTDGADLEFRGAPGLIVEIMAETGDYYNVLFENKRRGWMKKSLLAEI